MWRSIALDSSPAASTVCLSLKALVPENNQLQESNTSKDRCKVDQISIIRRFLFSVFALLLGFFLSLCGWKNLNNNGSFLGSALIGLGSLLGLCGFLVLLL
jgi:hypothetical protein